MKVILIKYGELTTKGDNRKYFINVLYKNKKKALEGYNVNIVKNLFHLKRGQKFWQRFGSFRCIEAHCRVRVRAFFTIQKFIKSSQGRNFSRNCVFFIIKFLYKVQVFSHFCQSDLANVCVANPK